MCVTIDSQREKKPNTCFQKTVRTTAAFYTPTIVTTNGGPSRVRFSGTTSVVSENVAQTCPGHDVPRLKKKILYAEYRV